MDFLQNCWEYYVQYPKHAFHFLANLLKSFRFMLMSIRFFENLSPIFVVYPFLMGKRVKVHKMWIKKQRSFSL